MVSARRAFDEDRSLNLDLTVDVLTGATPAGGVPANAMQTFTSPSGKDSYDVAPGVTPLDDSFLDTRVALAGNWQQALGESMRWGAGLSVSDEYDYFHLGVNGRLERDFNNRNTTVYAGAAYAQDDINPVGGAPIPLAPMLEVGNLDSKLADDSKDVLDLLLGFTQVLSRRSLLEVAYSYGSSDGYLNDPYKFLTVVDPDHRHAGRGSARQRTQSLSLREPARLAREAEPVCRVAARLRPRLHGDQLPHHG